MKHIDVDEFKRLRSSSDIQLVDVREPAEQETERLPGCISAPLSALEKNIERLDSRKTVILVCLSGARAAQAAKTLCDRGFMDVRVLEGGLTACRKQGVEIERGERSTWALDRQVRLTAGGLVVIGAVAGFFADPRWHVLSGLIGAGLMFSALTDTCAMGSLIARMPWNRARTISKERL